MGEYVTVADLAEYPGVIDRYASDRIRECGDAYVIRGDFCGKSRQDGKPEINRFSVFYGKREIIAFPFFTEKRLIYKSFPFRFFVPCVGKGLTARPFPTAKREPRAFLPNG